LPQVTLRQATSVSCTTCMLKRLWSQKILNQPNACMLIKLRFELHKLHYPSRHADVTVDRFALPVPLARARRRLSALGGIYASIFRSHTSPHTMMFTIARRAEKFKVRLCPFRKKKSRFWGVRQLQPNTAGTATTTFRAPWPWLPAPPAPNRTTSLCGRPHGRPSKSRPDFYSLTWLITYTPNLYPPSYLQFLLLVSFF
jgi:hypothetical protein